MKTPNTYKFFVLCDDEKLYIHRSVTHTHDARIHAAMGTVDETELQRALDQCNASDWFDGLIYRGEDVNGVGVERTNR